MFVCKIITSYLIPFFFIDNILNSPTIVAEKKYDLYYIRSLIVIKWNTIQRSQLRVRLD